MKRALISVYDKNNIEKSAKVLSDNNWEIISTGGTAKYLKDKGIKVREVSDITNFPEILSGRVKTLNPMIFGPILAEHKEKHLNDLKNHNLTPIHLVIVNFYPFEEALKQNSDNLQYMIENIDIGGPSMVRAAAKNHKYVTVVTDPKDYLKVTSMIVDKDGINDKERYNLAKKAFAYTSFYDSMIAEYLYNRDDDNQERTYFSIHGKEKNSLRYGENPHQKASLYITDNKSPLNNFIQHQGKELSFNNILDFSMTYELSNEFKDEPFALIVKHQNPCGAAIGKDIEEAYKKALSTDPKSAFGGIVALNQKINKKLASTMKEMFFEVIIAPAYDEEALNIFKKKKNLRIIEIPFNYQEKKDLRIVPGGFLLQERDNKSLDKNNLSSKTGSNISEKDMADIDFGWKIIKYVKSNAIILVKDKKLIGVGAGQMSRVDSVEIAIRKAQSSIKDSMMLSDAFFPFPDSIETAAQAGIKTVVEPGGSIRDDEVIKTAKEKGINLIFTHQRHFKH